MVNIANFQHCLCGFFISLTCCKSVPKRYPKHSENDAKLAWEKLHQETERGGRAEEAGGHGKTFSRETTLMRLLILAHVLNRPLVVHSDEPLHPEESADGAHPHKIKVLM
jgi:hypothetical protein